MRTHRLAIFSAAFVALSFHTRAARADDTLHVGTPTLDPPTLVALGIELPITGDDNFTGTVAVRYRVTGTSAWRDAMPLLHVHVEAVQGLTVQPHFAGSIFDLVPATAYDIELHATDSDGNVDTTLMLNGTTRGVPGDPMHPHAVPVQDVASLNAALNAAQPGDVITLAAGTYDGNFVLQASGTADDPIVIRGASQDSVILDGMSCTGCNVIEAYGSFTHIESLTIQHATRAIRFQGMGADQNVVRRTHITDVTLAIGSQPNQQNFYIADNVIEGRLVWPCVYTSDDPACNTDSGGAVTHGTHANDDGIHVEGEGHVICHNTLSGFGDAMKTEQDGVHSVDFYNNDVLWTYDNGIELDGSAGNTRALRNRFTNTFATLSFQPIYGGPGYAIRNILVNVADEQFKLHSNGTIPTVGAVILHTTVVRGTRAVQCSTDQSPLDFTVQNNLFVGPAVLDPDGHAVRWDVPNVNTGSIDFNGYYPDGQFEYGYDKTNGGVTFPTFAAASMNGMWDAHSKLVSDATFSDGSLGTTDWHLTLVPVTPAPSTNSDAIDAATFIPNVDDGFQGAAPDLGALEAGCPLPVYGPRPVGMDETNEVWGCPVATGTGGAGGMMGAAGASQAGAGGAANGGTGPSTGGAANTGGAGTTGGHGTATGGQGTGTAGHAGNGAAGATHAGGAAGTHSIGGATSTAGFAGAGGQSGAGVTPDAASQSDDSGGCGCRTVDSHGSRERGLVVASFASFALVAAIMSRLSRRRRLSSAESTSSARCVPNAGKISQIHLRVAQLVYASPIHVRAHFSSRVLRSCFDPRRLRLLVGR